MATGVTMALQLGTIASVQATDLVCSSRSLTICREKFFFWFRLELLLRSSFHLRKSWIFTVEHLKNAVVIDESYFVSELSGGLLWNLNLAYKENVRSSAQI